MKARLPVAVSRWEKNLLVLLNDLNSYFNLIVTYNKIPLTKHWVSTSSTHPSVKPAMFAKQDLIEASKDKADLVQRGTR